MVVVEVIPYVSAEERRQLTKEIKECKVFIYPTYIIFERMVAMQ